LIDSSIDQNLENYDYIFKDSLDAILLAYNDGKIFYANHSTEKLLGYSQKELYELGKNELLDSKNPNWTVMLNEIVRNNKSKCELTLIRKDCSKFPAEVSANSFKDKKDNINIFLTIKDITHHKKNTKESEYHALLLNKVNESVIGTDANYTITYWNKCTEQMYGYTAEEAIEKNSLELLHPIYTIDEREKIIAKMEHYRNSKVITRVKH